VICAAACTSGAQPTANRGFPLSIHNRTAGPIHLYWFNRPNPETFYQTIPPGKSASQVSFAGHEWVLRDATGQVVKHFKASPAAREIIVSAPASVAVPAPVIPPRVPVGQGVAGQGVVGPLPQGVLGTAPQPPPQFSMAISRPVEPRPTGPRPPVPQPSVAQPPVPQPPVPRPAEPLPKVDPNQVAGWVGRWTATDATDPAQPKVRRVMLVLKEQNFFLIEDGQSPVALAAVPGNNRQLRLDANRMLHFNTDQDGFWIEGGRAQPFARTRDFEVVGHWLALVVQPQQSVPVPISCYVENIPTGIRVTVGQQRHDLTLDPFVPGAYRHADGKSVLMFVNSGTAVGSAPIFPGTLMQFVRNTGFPVDGKWVARTLPDQTRGYDLDLATVPEGVRIRRNDGQTFVLKHDPAQPNSYLDPNFVGHRLGLSSNRQGVYIWPPYGVLQAWRPEYVPSLDKTQSLERYAFLCTHNAYCTRPDNWTHCMHLRNIETQLKDGVRALMLDLHYHNPGTINSIPIIGDINKAYDGATAGLFLCHGDPTGVVGITYALPRQRLSATLNTVRDFLRKNPDEIVILLLEDYSTKEQLWAAIRESAGFEQLIYNPDDPAGWRIADKGWPTLGWLRWYDKRVIMLSSRDEYQNNKDGTAIGYTYDHCVENDWDIGQGRVTPESFKIVKRGSSMELTTPNKLFILNNFRSLPAEIAAPFDNNYRNIIDRIDKANWNPTRRIPNILAVDFYHLGDFGGPAKVVEELNRRLAP